MAFSGVALASQGNMQAGITPASKVTVVEKGPNGRAQIVMVNGKQYQVCGGDVTDNCINPRAAGLGYGDRPLDYWPGKPASEM